MIRSNAILFGYDTIRLISDSEKTRRYYQKSYSIKRQAQLSKSHPGVAVLDPRRFGRVRQNQRESQLPISRKMAAIARCLEIAVVAGQTSYSPYSVRLPPKIPGYGLHGRYTTSTDTGVRLGRASCLNMRLFAKARSGCPI